MDWIKCIANRLLLAGRRQAGVTLIETVMAIALFGVVSTSLMTVLTSATVADGLARQRTIAKELLEQQVEYIRQLNYENAGTISGNPPGNVLPVQQKNVAGLWYRLETQIKWVNDPIPNSFVTYANYKRVRVIVFRANDDKELARITTYLSSATREALGGIDNATINVQALDPFIYEDPDTPESEQALENVTIALAYTGGIFSATDTTDEGGLVTFPALDPTETGYYYDVAASRSGYVTHPSYVPPNTPAHLSLPASGTITTTIQLFQPCTIHVDVIDETTGLPYTGEATVTVSSSPTIPLYSETKTLSGGSFEFTGTEDNPIVPGAEYLVTVAAGGRLGDHLRTGEPAQNLAVPIDYPLDRSADFDINLEEEIIPVTAILRVYVRRMRTWWPSSMTCWDSSENISQANVYVADDATPLPDLPEYQSVYPPGGTNSSGWVEFDVDLGTYDSVTASKRISGHNRSNHVDDVTVNGDPANDRVCVGLRY